MVAAYFFILLLLFYQTMNYYRSTSCYYPIMSLSSHVTKGPLYQLKKKNTFRCFFLCLTNHQISPASKFVLGRFLIFPKNIFIGPVLTGMSFLLLTFWGFFFWVQRFKVSRLLFQFDKLSSICCRLNLSKSVKNQPLPITKRLSGHPPNPQTLVRQELEYFRNISHFSHYF